MSLSTQPDRSEENVMTTATLDQTISPAIDSGTELREGYAQVGDVELHYVEAGDGPLVLLLHGFPEFWYSWRRQIAPLVEAGFHVVAPDLRGYNLSSKPDRFTDYTADKPADDIRGMIHELGAESAMVVGHDWGGSVAWTLAMNHPEVVDRLVILNAAHPRKLNEGLKDRGSSCAAGTSSTSSSQGCQSAVRAAGTGASSSASCATPARRTRTMSSTAMPTRGRSPAPRRR
jgi:pimeloyl-ACP methyl ester carboxylesterase